MARNKSVKLNWWFELWFEMEAIQQSKLVVAPHVHYLKWLLWMENMCVKHDQWILTAKGSAILSSVDYKTTNKELTIMVFCSWVWVCVCEYALFSFWNENNERYHDSLRCTIPIFLCVCAMSLCFLFFFFSFLSSSREIRRVDLKSWKQWAHFMVYMETLRLTKIVRH